MKKKKFIDPEMEVIYLAGEIMTDDAASSCDRHSDIEACDFD